MSLDQTQLTDKQKRKLEKLAKLVEEGNTAILEHLFELEERLDEEIPGLKTVLDQVKGKDGLDSTVPGPQGEIGPQGEKGDSIIGPQGKEGPTGPIGPRGSDGLDGKDGIPGINGKDGSPDTGKQIVDKVNALPFGEDDDELKIGVEHIKGWKKWLEKEIAKIRSKTVFVGGGGSGGRIVKGYDLSASLDGVTKTFTLPSFWRIISVHSSSSPNILRPTTDYTTSGSTITFTSEIDAATVLAIPQTLLIVYAEL